MTKRWGSRELDRHRDRNKERITRTYGYYDWHRIALQAFTEFMGRVEETKQNKEAKKVYDEKTKTYMKRMGI